MLSTTSGTEMTRVEGYPAGDRRSGEYWDTNFPSGMPIIVCLCGSTRFSAAFQEAGLAETLAGRIVVTIGAALKSDQEHFGHLPAAELQALKQRLDALHLHKIALADEVLILNVDGYVGPSTERELSYAVFCAKTIRFLEPVPVDYLDRVPAFFELAPPTT